jgi:cytochrome c oxidase subunit II
MNEFLRRILFLPPQASSMAEELDYLHYSVIGLTMLGATLVAAVAGYFILRYRRRPGAPKTVPNPDPNPLPRVMTFWFELTVIVGLLGLFVSWWLVGYRQFVRLEVPPAQAMNIYVTAKQWMWTFIYPNGRTSNVVLYVPANRPVKLIMSSRDVIHSFFVPDFRVKKDVIPGRMTTLWFEAKAPGVYPVFCAEYCGEGHSTMRAEVVALREEDYVAKLEQLPRLDVGGPSYVEPALTDNMRSQLLSLAEMGERVAVMKGCMRCHTADGTPHIGPSWLGLYYSQVPLANGSERTADEAYLTQSMMDPLAQIHTGFPPVMPSYQGLLTAAETAAIVEYIRYLSTRSAETRLSPLAPVGSAPVQLPSASSEVLDREEVPRPVGGVPQPRSDSPPYSPQGTEPSHPNAQGSP